MELGKLATRNHHDHPRGVALLISLSVILLLSIALMKNFEKRSLEVAHLGNNLERFQAESLARSGLNLILVIIRERGLSTVEAYKSQLLEIEIPIGNGIFKFNELSPIDHRFNLNRKISSGDDHRIFVFKNMVRSNKNLSEGYNYVSGENEIEALSAINDWIDRDPDMDEVFRYDSEQYYREEPSFYVKNREFDRLSEVKLLPAFRRLGFSADFLGKNFRVLGGTDEYVDINLINEKSLKDFLGRYENVDGYNRLFVWQNEIWELIEKRQLSRSSNFESGAGDVKTAFPAKNFKRDWTDTLVAAGINLEEKEIELFQPYSKTLFIRFQVQVGKATMNIQSIVQVGYRNTEKNLDISTLKILSFRII